MIAASWIIIFTSSLIFAQKLPFKSYTTADGLGHNRVKRIYQDRKGFLWFATFEGLSRFDGYEFENYSVSDGLPNPIINDVLEDGQGRLWVAANDSGIALLNEKREPDSNSSEAPMKFTKFLLDKTIHGANKVNRLLIDSRNDLWCLTDDGIYRAPVSDNPVFTRIKPYQQPVVADASMALFEDQQGNVWFGIHNELFEARGDEIINHGFINGDENNFIINALQTRDGRIIILSRENGIFEFLSEKAKWQKLHDVTKKVHYFYSLIEDSQGFLWFGGDGGFIKLADGKLTEYTNEQGFDGDRVIALFQDREGNFWSGSRSAGVIKLPDMAISTYSLANGEISLGIAEIDGKLKTFSCIVNKENRWTCQTKIKSLTDNRTEDFARILPIARSFALSKRGEDWGTFSQVGIFPIVKDTSFKFPDGSKVDLKEFFDKPFKENDDIIGYLDERNFLWVSKTDGSFYRIKPAGDGSREIEKFKWEFKSTADVMIGDRQGGLWLFKRGVTGGRFRNGEYESFDSLFRDFSEKEGFEYLKTIPTQVSTAFFDSRKWLWAGSFYEGLFVCKNPAGEKPVFEKYTTENGLLSDSVWDINEDNDGKMYFGTGRGLSRFDVEKNVWNDFTTKDGLASDRVANLFKDLRGNIWINTRAGLTRLNPKMESQSSESPLIYITHIKIAGKELPVSETGFVETAPVLLESSQNNLTIDFVGLQYKNEDSLNYQYKLEGADADWSKPNKSRTIYFASLDSGNYRFLVRAINENGLVSAQPAVFQFKISPPLYLRWWFIAFSILLLFAVVYAFYRLRLQRLLEVERTRTLIATDLHDDIGSNLSKISVLSEVVRLQLEREGKSDDKLLSSIADISRQSVGSMSDIVWAINPKRDSVLEMVRKMREHAEEIFVPKEITVKFSEPDRIGKIKLPMDLRRDLYLIFKEAINNIAKHADCTKVQINFDIHHHEIILQIEDNGRGFDSAQEINGNGLTNMQKRTDRLKGSFQVDSAPSEGTKIIVRIPQN